MLILTVQLHSVWNYNSLLAYAVRIMWIKANQMSFFVPRACNSLFTALEKSQEAIEITSEDHVIQVCSSYFYKYRKLLCRLTVFYFIHDHIYFFFFFMIQKSNLT